MMFSVSWIGKAVEGRGYSLVLTSILHLSKEVVRNQCAAMLPV
jgi:hypothetical protein